MEPPRVVMYSLNGCPFCIQAIDLLKSEGVATKLYEFHRVRRSAKEEEWHAELTTLWEEAKKLRRSAAAAGLQPARPAAAHMTFPQIFRVVGIQRRRRRGVDEEEELLQHIGGFDSLRDYVAADGFSR